VSAPAAGPAGRSVLVAGVGNVFLGDDGFGVAVVRRLAERPHPSGAVFADYGIRGLHLAYDLLEQRFSTLILVDVVPLDAPPGTVVVLEPDLDARRGASDAAGAVPDAHGMDPATVLDLLRTLDGFGPGRVERVYVVGCRPERLEEGMDLSAPVAAAVDEAARAVLDLLEAQPPPSRKPVTTAPNCQPEASWTSSSF
jgi:hydrogenase maturation protease